MAYKVSFNNVFNLKNLIVTFAIICSLLTLKYFINKGNKEFRDEILSNKCIVVGEITDYVDRGDAGAFIVYKYKFNNQIYEETSSIQFSHIRNFINKKFPIILSCRKPEFSRILILPDNFEFFNMEFPDSLEWVKEFEK